jgi:enterochelin esterase family protein
MMKAGSFAAFLNWRSGAGRQSTHHNPGEWDLDASPAASNIKGAQFPRVTQDGRALFRVVAPGARRVEIRLAGSHPMKRAEDGALQPPDETCRGRRVVGAHAADSARLPVLLGGGGQRGVLRPGQRVVLRRQPDGSGRIPEPGVTFHETRDVPHGVVRVERYWSPNRKAWRRMHVYAAPGYRAGPRPWPMLPHHGAGEDDRGWSQQGRIADIPTT